jgi:hypothetical protein
MKFETNSKYNIKLFCYCTKKTQKKTEKQRKNKEKTQKKYSLGGGTERNTSVFVSSSILHFSNDPYKGWL